jgi:hypothetical protein
MTKHPTMTATGFWHRATQALGKLWAAMVSLPADERPAGRRTAADAYPRFPAF